MSVPPSSPSGVYKVGDHMAFDVESHTGTSVAAAGKSRRVLYGGIGSVLALLVVGAIILAVVLSSKSSSSDSSGAGGSADNTNNAANGGSGGGGTGSGGGGVVIVSCALGNYCDSVSASATTCATSSTCRICPSGFYCPSIDVATKTACPAGTNCPPGSTSPTVFAVRVGVSWLSNANSAYAVSNGMRGWTFVQIPSTPEDVARYNGALIQYSGSFINHCPTGLYVGANVFWDATVIPGKNQPRHFYVMSGQPHTLPGMVAGSRYRFSTRVRVDTGQAKAVYNCEQARFLVFRQNTGTLHGNDGYDSSIYANRSPSSLDGQAWNVTNSADMGTGDPNTVIASYAIPCTNFNTSSNGTPADASGFITLSTEFIMLIDVADAIIGLYINPSWVSPTNPNVTGLTGRNYDAWRFENIAVSLVAGQPQRKPDFVHPLQTGASEVVTLPKQSQALDPEDRSSACPHLAPGLTPWESVVTASNEADLVLTLPAASSILFSRASNPRAVWYHKIVIPVTTTLIFDDVPLSFHFENMLVLGALRIGDAKCRMQSVQEYVIHAVANTTVLGVATAADPLCHQCVGVIGTKLGAQGIAAPTPDAAYPLTSSIIDLHAYQYTPTWQRLAASVWPGDVAIYLQDTSNWEVGQTIAIITSTFWDEVKPQNEQLVIAAVIDGGRIIALASPAMFHHHAGPEYQSEVGLLSRRVVIRGYDADGSATAAQRGGHVLSMGQLRASGIELAQMGQRNTMGRYPLHWHLAGESSKYSAQGGQFIRDCSVHQSFFRCVAIHGTHNATVTRNVGVDAIGHCFFIEDGIEQINTISFNLAAHIHAILPATNLRVVGRPNLPAVYSLYEPPGNWPYMAGYGQVATTIEYGSGLAHASDAAPAPFYITNANNRFIGNAASGGWTGFSFISLPKVTGLSYANNTGYAPNMAKSLEFDGNSAHSAGYTWHEGGACVYGGGRLLWDGTKTGANGEVGDFRYADGRESGYERWVITLTNTKVWLCQKGFSHWGPPGGQKYLNNATLFEVHDSLWLANWFSGAMDKGVYNAHSSNPSWHMKFGSGFRSYDQFSQDLLTNITFKNFLLAPETDYPCGYMFQHIIQSQSGNTAPLSAWNNNRFVNVDRSVVVNLFNTTTSVYNWLGGGFSATHCDWDGSTASMATNTYVLQGNQGSSVRTPDQDPTNMNLDVAWPAGRPAYIAQAHQNTSFWHVDNSCMLNELWHAYICEMTDKKRPANIGWSAGTAAAAGLKTDSTSAYQISWNPQYSNAVPDPQFGAILGNVTLFGAGLTKPDRTQMLWNVAGLTGISGMGWWINMHATGGSPNSFTLSPNLLFPFTSVIVAMPYPAGSVFAVKTRYGWGGSVNGAWHSVTQQTSYDALVAQVYPNSGWLFDGSNFFLRFWNTPGDGQGHNDPTKWTYSSGGAYINQGPYGTNDQYFTWAVNCTGVTAFNICPVATPIFPVVTAA